MGIITVGAEKGLRDQRQTYNLNRILGFQRERLKACHFYAFFVSISRKNLIKSTVKIVGLCQSHTTIYAFFFTSKLPLQGCYNYFIRNIQLVSGDVVCFFSVFMGDGSQNITKKKMFSRARLKFPCFFLGGVKVNDAE